MNQPNPLVVQALHFVAPAVAALVIFFLIVTAALAYLNREDARHGRMAELDWTERNRQWLDSSTVARDIEPGP